MATSVVQVERIGLDDPPTSLSIRLSLSEERREYKLEMGDALYGKL
jgi:hypothetical protein